MQPLALVMSTLKPTGTLLPTEKVMLRVPCPAVIVPLLTIQLYMAPTPASGTLARLPVELTHTATGAVIVALGSGFTVTCRVPIALQPGKGVTVTFSVTGEVPLAVQVMLRVFAPLLIVPLVIVQAYVAPIPASGTLAVLPVEPAQTAAGAVIVVSIAGQPTVSVALAGAAVSAGQATTAPTAVPVRLLIVFKAAPVVALVTFTWIWQLVAPAASEPFAKLMELLPVVAPVTVPPQVFIRPGVPATVKPAGKLSVNAKLSICLLSARLLIVSVIWLTPPGLIVIGLKALLSVGGTTTSTVPNALPRENGVPLKLAVPLAVAV